MPQTDKHKNLIQEGLSWYLDAMVALDEFTRLIQNDCRSILETNAARLEKASGLTFSREITAESDPYNGRGRTWDSQFAWIGAFLPVKTADKFHSFGVGIYWEHENGELRPGAIPSSILKHVRLWMKSQRGSMLSLLASLT